MDLEYKCSLYTVKKQEKIQIIHELEQELDTLNNEIERYRREEEVGSIIYNDILL